MAKKIRKMHIKKTYATKNGLDFSDVALLYSTMVKGCKSLLLQCSNNAMCFRSDCVLKKENDGD
jgi:hypothetical protein